MEAAVPGALLQGAREKENSAIPNETQCDDHSEAFELSQKVFNLLWSPPLTQVLFIFIMDG